MKLIQIEYTLVTIFISHDWITTPVTTVLIYRWHPSGFLRRWKRYTNPSAPRNSSTQL
jgi:hypothetical protein